MTKERVTLLTILAGPNGVADAGTTIEVDSAFAEQLRKAGSAVSPAAIVAATRPATAPVAAAGGPAAEPVETPAEKEARESREREAAAKAEADREAGAKSPDNIKAALDKLDPKDEEHWIGNGKPQLAAVKELAGSKTLTRAELDAMFPEFLRPDGAPADDKGGGGSRRSSAP
jgi:hypothetical protein